MFVLILINFLLAAASWVYLYITHKLSYWKDQGIPFIEPQFFYGNSKGIGREFHFCDFIQRMYNSVKTKGRFGGIYIFTKPILVITDLDLIKQILVKDFHVFPNRQHHVKDEKNPIGTNLVNLQDDEWKSLRNKLTPTFTSGKIKMMFELVTQVADRLVATIDKEKKLDEGGAVEIKNTMARFTTDVIASTAFGIESNTLGDKTNEFLEMGLKAFAPGSFVKRHFVLNFPKLSRKLGISTSNKEIQNFYINVVRETIQYRKSNPQVQRNDFMNLLIKLHDASLSDALTFHEVVAQSQVFFLAGYETSSTTLTYCLYELSQNQEIQEKARESVKQVLKNHNNVLTYEAINEMEYLEQCVNESLRKYPPAAATARIAKEDYVIPDTKFVIKKDTSVNIPIYGIHRDPEIYPEPEKFDPDRFSKEETAKRHQYAFLPFGEGPRVCIGMRFAVIEIKVALAKLLTSFKFELDTSRTSVPMKIAPAKLVIMSPAEDIFVKFARL